MTAAARSAVRQEPRRPFANWIGGVACGLALMVTPATVLLLAAALAPTGLVRLLDDAANRGLFRSVLLCNVTAVIGPMFRLWRGGPPDLGRTLSILSEPRVLCSAWLAGSAAWVGCELLSMLSHRCLVLRDQRLAARLTTDIKRLRDEWDLDAERPAA